MADAVVDPPHFGPGKPSSLAASAIPLWVCTKNRFVVTWLTNQNCQAGVAGKFPATALAVDVADAEDVEVALLELAELHAAISAEAAAGEWGRPACSGSQSLHRLPGRPFFSSKDLHGISRDGMLSRAEPRSRRDPSTSSRER